MTRSLSLEDISSAAKLHMAGITGGFLSSLGEKFLTLMYKAVNASGESVLVIHKINGEVAGFAAATQNINDIYQKMLSYKRQLFCTVFKVLFSPAKIKRIFETIFYTKKSTPFITANELLSIAVKEEYRGKGVADQIFSEVVDYFKTQGASSFKVVVGAELVPARRFYERMGALPSGEISVHGSQKSIIYVYDLKEKRNDSV